MHSQLHLCSPSLVCSFLPLIQQHRKWGEKKVWGFTGWSCYDNKISRSASTFLFYIFIYFNSFCCWRFLMRHARDPLNRFRLGTLACWRDFVFNISSKWVFSFHSVPFKNSPGSTPCLQLCTMICQKGPLSCFFLLWLY